MAKTRPQRSREPFFWSLFSAGGMLAALALPALAALLWLAWPLGWLAAPAHAELAGRLGHPLVRLALFAFITLALFHWAHRFRFTLYDGLQLSHLWGLIATVTYGGATLLMLLAGYLLWTFP
jgi:fumarate reductase subunit D